MDIAESHAPDAAFNDALSRARAQLRTPIGGERIWPVVVSAVLFAVCSLSFATAAILAPPVQLDPITAPRAPAL